MLRSRFKLGDVLISEGLISQEQLVQALDIQRREGGTLGTILVKLGMLNEQDLLMALGKQLKIQYVSRGSGLLQPQVGEGLEQLIPAEFAREHALLPIARHMNSLTVAISDPLDVITLDNLAKMTRCRINPILATRADILQGIQTFYGDDQMLKEAIDQSYKIAATEASVGAAPAATGLEDELSLERLKAQAEEAPVVRLVDLLLRQAIKERASDIHIEPWADRIGLRFRIDGQLYDRTPPARSLHAPIISRIKILSKLDIAEKRLPQDGGFSMQSEGRQVDFRVATIPTLYGEKVVIRILDQQSALLQLSQLGFGMQDLERFRQAFRHPNGLILVTGPTGSGKTTTLYAALQEHRTPHRNFLTVEDPVEYRLEGITQVQVNTNIGLTFATALRSFLRQDPDVIMVGEVRDLETAEICVRAALTGHPVLSTLHTNDAPSAVTRLIDLGVPPFLLSSTLVLVAAQRLMRKLCPACKEAYEPSPALLSQLELSHPVPLYHAKGCAQCNQTGYRGREAIYELMLLDNPLRELISKGASTHILRDGAKKTGMTTLWDAAKQKVVEGLSSFEELSSTVLLERA